LRAHAAPVPCEVSAADDGGLHIRLAHDQRGVAPGQSAVLYEPDAERGDRVLGQAAVRTTSERLETVPSQALA
jgi:tRNA-specific 2-thiouridylase